MLIENLKIAFLVLEGPGDLHQLENRAGKPVQFCDDKDISLPDVVQRLIKCRSDDSLAPETFSSKILSQADNRSLCRLRFWTVVLTRAYPTLCQFIVPNLSPSLAFSTFLLAFVHNWYSLTGKNYRRRHLMATVATTKMSSKGQVVIPEDVRKRLNLKAGTQFVVVGDSDVVILKAITPPSMDEFDGLVAKARRQAKAAGLKKSDIADAIAVVRGSM